ncbi:MAG: hypothetical protein V1929_13270, partial [bacterium]
MLKNDKWIAMMARKGMIRPFAPRLVRRVEGGAVISYGLGSYGYDIRLSPIDFRIFRHVPGTVVDPKQFSADNLEHAKLHRDPWSFPLSANEADLLGQHFFLDKFLPNCFSMLDEQYTSAGKQALGARI